MWQRLLDLLSKCRRPLVVLDFETAGLNGAPPVEMAIAYWAPWCPPNDDPVTAKARAVCPPGLTYATTMRLDPGCPIDPRSMAVHGIRDEDVIGKAVRFKDLEVVAMFQHLDAGDASAGEGRAIWCGHNVAESDVPWAKIWGYLPWRDDITVVDTMRMQRRLTKEHPSPLTPDAAVNCDGVWRDRRAGTLPWAKGCPVVSHGLRPYASNLEGLHTAMFGDPHEGGHGALADACASARSFAATLELWAVLWSSASQRDDDPAADLERLLAALDAPPPGQASWDGWLEVVPMDALPRGQRFLVGAADRPRNYTWRRGRFRGEPAHRDQWVLGLPRTPTGVDGKGWCSPVTAKILEGL